MSNFNKDTEEELLTRGRLMADSFSNVRHKKLMNYRINYYEFTQTIYGGKSELELHNLKTFINEQIKVLNYA